MYEIKYDIEKSIFLYRLRNGLLFITDEEPNIFGGEVYPKLGKRGIQLKSNLFENVQPGTCVEYIPKVNE